MRKETFSVYNRDALLQCLTENKLELLVIGGGITGAGIAWDAAVRYERGPFGNERFRLRYQQ